MKFKTVQLGTNNAVGVNTAPEGTVLVFKCPNLEKETNPKMVHVETTDEEIATFLKLTPKAAVALRALLNQEIKDE